jgi:protocatechuate 3,4-dioxygenase beta subunit
VVAIAAALFLAAAVAQAAVPPAGPDCIECPHHEAPAALTASLVIPTVGFEGARLIVEGTVYRPDGRTPAAGILVYAYHTSSAGLYPHPSGATGMERWHGSLRGWLVTGADGRYRIETIRPGPYPGGAIPAHIHMHVMPPGGRERYIDDIVFEDDPRVDAAYRSRARDIGGPGIVRLTRDTAGVLRATRDIILPD